MPSATGPCALPMDGLNACPPEAHSCFTCPHYRTDAPRREEAAQLALELRAEGAAHIRARIFDALRSFPRGLTSEEVAKAARLNPNTVRGRLSELEAEGVVRRKTARRRTASGRPARLYVVAEVRP